MDFETAYYIIHYFPRLLNPKELAALIHQRAIFKIGPVEKYDSIERYNKRLEFYQNNISKEPEVLELLSQGNGQFYVNSATRILKETPDKVYLNKCPKCNQLARTPYAKQCKHCGYSWHDTIAATFLVKSVFSITSHPQHLYFAGDIKSGTIKLQMKVDLTFFGVAAKPAIDFWGFLDFISEKRAEVGLGVKIESEEDREYLKKRKSLAVPIIIENAFNE
jgi:hypothetical protein